MPNYWLFRIPLLKRILCRFIRSHYLSGWVVLLIDLCLIAACYVFVWLVYYSMMERPFNYHFVLIQMAAGFPLFLASYMVFRPHRGILRYAAGSDDARALLFMHILASSGLLVISFVARNFAEYRPLYIHWGILLIHFAISILFLMTFRLLTHYFYMVLIHNVHKKRNILIYGAGELGLITKNIIVADHESCVNIAGFIDDNPLLVGKVIQGIKVFSAAEAFDKIISEKAVKEVIVAISPGKISPDRKHEIVSTCLRLNLLVKEVPAPWRWLNGILDVNQIQTVRIEDLLGRDVITLKNGDVKKGIAGRRVMVTGGAGSIGSEIVRQLIQFHPAEIVLVDIAESAMFELCHEPEVEKYAVTLQQVIADVSDETRMRGIFKEFHPEIIYHASAYKHVPMMEKQPYEAVKTNIKGTKIVADLAMEHGVSIFVMISTDKAVNPSNVMGASKRICELYIQSLACIPGVTTRFITTRFGNVLGSNGSVIPVFRKQIAGGGPVTVTHHDIIRYFMTIPEASQLVLEAGFMGKGGEIFLFDMGNPIRIYDLAEKMISLAGYIPHKDIKIVETGLRPGEKLFEELLIEDEHKLPTHHQKIMIANSHPGEYLRTKHRIDQLVRKYATLSDLEMVGIMKKIVPAFISMNSVFANLDTRKLKEEGAEKLPA